MRLLWLRFAVRCGQASGKLLQSKRRSSGAPYLRKRRCLNEPDYDPDYCWSHLCHPCGDYYYAPQEDGSQTPPAAIAETSHASFAFAPANEWVSAAGVRHVGLDAGMAG